LPRYFDDFVLLAKVAKFADEVETDQQLAAISWVKINLSPQNFSEEFSTDGEIALSAMNYCSEVPSCFEDLEGGDDQEYWYKAIDEESQSLEENDTWKSMPLPHSKIPIKSKWVFALKYNGDGQVDRYKARLVIKGCAQKPGIDYHETYAPVARLSTVRVLLSLINKLNLHAHQLDVKNAF